jgi:Ca2+-binding RTX toxin-like protein
MSRRWLLLGFVLLVAGGVVASQSAQAADGNASAIKAGLTSFAQDGLGKLGLPVDSDTADHLKQLSDALPLSSLNPVGPGGLDLANLLDDAVKNASEDSVGALASSLNGVNTDVGDGVIVKLGTGGACVASPCAAPGEVTIVGTAPYVLTLPFDATKTVHVPLHLPTDVSDLSGPGSQAKDELAIKLELKGTLAFGYNPAGATGQQFFLVTGAGGTNLTFTADADGASTPSFKADLGFTRVSATASLDALHVSLALKLVSPHPTGDENVGRITQYDWLNSQPQDLMTVTRSGNAAATVSLDSDLIKGSPDLTFQVSGSLSPTAGFTPSYRLSTGGTLGTASPTLSGLLTGLAIKDFTNVTPGDVLAGFGQLAAGLAAIQNRADVHLPFLQGGVASTLDMISKLAQMLAQQTVTCGTMDGAPPTGTTYGLKKGTAVYCRATTTDTVKTGSVVWAPLAATATTSSNGKDSDADGTIAVAPSKSAVFTTVTDYVPPVIGANYLIDGTSTSKGVSQPVPTAQELFDALISQAGFLSTSATVDAGSFGKHTPASLTYDSGTHSLRFHLLKIFQAADNKELSSKFDFGDRLKDSTGLFGLSPDSGASVTLKAGKAVLDVTFGVLLGSKAEVAASTPAPASRSFLDRFFVQRSDDGAGGTAPLLAIEDTSVTADVKLKGQVGFVGITAAGNPKACAGGTQAFCLSAADTSKPLVSLDLVPQTQTDGDTGGSGGSLGITVGGQTIPDAISLPVLLPNAISHLAITPNVHVAGGLTIKANVGSTELASGGVGFDWTVKDMGALLKPTVITSGDPADDKLLVTTDSSFGDSLKKFWEMAKSDPKAMLRVLLDALSGLADDASKAGGSDFDTQLPLVNVTPRQLLVQFQQLKSAIDELSGGGNTLTTCTITAPAGHAALPASAAVAGDTLRCNATYPAAVSGVAWTANSVYTNNTGTDETVGGQTIPAGGSWAEPVAKSYVKTADGTTGAADATIATATPSDAVEFTLPDDASKNFTGFQVHVDFSDAIGKHSADLPAVSAPSTLQGFRDWLAGKLGLDPAVLTFDLVDAPDANNPGNLVKTLKLGLKYDVCTEGWSGCSGGAAMVVPKLQLPLNLDLGNLGDGLSPSLQTTGTVSLSFKAHAQLDVGLPLGNLLPTSTSDGASSTGQCAQDQTGADCKKTGALFEIFNTTGASVEAAADGDGLGGKASLGPLSLAFGTSSPPRDGKASDVTESHASVGKVHVGGSVTVGVPAGDKDPVTYTVGGFTSKFAATFDNSTSGASSCGTYDADWADAPTGTPPVDPTLRQDVAGTACALFTMGIGKDYIGDLGLAWNAFAPAGKGFTLYVDKDMLKKKIQESVFSLDFLLKTLPQLLDSLQASLSNSGGTGDNKLPVVGNALDGGAKVVEQINNGVKAVINGINKYVGDAATPDAMTARANEFLFLQFASPDQVTAWGHAADAPYKDWPQVKLGLLLDGNGDKKVTPDDVGTKLTCLVEDPSPATTKTEKDCAGTSAGLSDIQSATVDMRIGQGGSDISKCADAAAPTDCKSFILPFDAGLDGFPLKVSGSVKASVGWMARLNFGLSRTQGPFIMVNHGSGTTPAKDVEVSAAVNLGAAPSSCAQDSTGQDQYIDAATASLSSNGLPTKFPFAKSTVDNRSCLSGTLGFLTVSAQDTDGSDAANGIDHTGIVLDAGVSFLEKGLTTYSAAGTRLSITDIAKFNAQLGVSAEANVNLLLRAGVDSATSSVGFPAVYGVFHAHWEWAKASGAPVPPSSAGPSELSMSQVYMDAGGLLNAYLKPIVEQVKKATGPFKPVVDTLYTPIPVVSQLAALVGKPPVTLIDLAEALSGNDLTMVKTVLGVIKFANDFKPTGDAVLIPMGTDAVKSYSASGAHFLGGGGGYFGLDKTLAKTPQTQTSAGQLVADPVASKGDSSGTGSLGDTIANNSEAQKQLPASARSKPTLLTDPIDGTTRWQTFGVAGLDIPLLRDPSLAFQVLMGQDITLVDYQFGGLHAQAGFSYTFGPFLVGPVPVSITIGGSVGVNGHLGIGYDTTGLRAVIGGGSPYRLLDGLYFDTYDASGHETPVLQLVGTVSAGAQVDLVVVKAGIEAVLKLTVNFFWDDPTPDGKMGFQDIGNKIANPICLFRVSGSLDAFLNAFVEFDFFVYSHKFSFTILKLHLLDFEGKCSPPSPEPATRVGTTLEINVGPHADRRHIAPDAHEEQAIVRMLPPVAQGGDGKQVSVSMFGAYKEYGDYATSGGEHITKVFADGGDKADDIELQPGAATSGKGVSTETGATDSDCTTDHPCAVPFTIFGDLRGGDDSDVLIGGDGGNFLDGGAGSDKLTGGIGSDLIQGGGGADTADGGRGDDKLCSGSWGSASFDAQSVSTCTAGAESVVFSGGPGGDTIVGGNDADQLDGGPGLDPEAIDPGSDAKATYGTTQPRGIDGNDVIVGNLGNDAISGGPGNDRISGSSSDLFDDYSCTTAGVAPGDKQSDDDVVDAGSGNDAVWGGSGDDQIKTGTGAVTAPHDFACGGKGNDVVLGDPTLGSSAGNDSLLGGEGNDSLTGGAGKDYVDGGPGNDLVLGGDNDDDVLGGTGRDVVNGGVGDDLAIGESATVDEYHTSTGIADINHSEAAAVFSSKATGVDETESSGTPIDCVTQAYDPTKDTGTGNEDCVVGGPGKDAMYGGGGADTMSGDDGNDWMSGGSNGDSMRGGLGDDQMLGDAGDDTMWGDSGSDLMYGGDDQDAMHGGPDSDYMEGNSGADTMWGDQADDRMVGGSADADAGDGNVSGHGDTMAGGAGDDVMLGDNGVINSDGTTSMKVGAAGSYGDDRMDGDDGNDQLYGQGGDDIMSGGLGADYLLGDLGAITGQGTNKPATWPGGAPNYAVALIAADDPSSGADTMHGDAADDHLYGGGGGDTVHGDDGDDYVEGNGGADSLFGDAGQDDLIGGSSGTNTSAEKLDEGDTLMSGGPDQDVLIGDNGTITRGVASDTATATTWTTDPITGGWGRTVALSYSDRKDCLSTVCGGDTMQGDGGNDRLYGEGGNDTMNGNDGEDYLEGNQNVDTVHGDPGDDDIIGGSSDIAGGTGDSATGRPDDGDQLFGDAGNDVIAGDNAIVTKTLGNAAGDPILQGFPVRQRTFTLLDLGTSSDGTFGDDAVNGGDGTDVLFGQSGADTVHGNDGDDYLEGNQSGDHLFGDAGQDDILGGSSKIASGTAAEQSAVGQPDAGDDIRGGADQDVILADNASLLRAHVRPPTVAASSRSGYLDDMTKNRGGMTLRQIDLYDLGSAADGTSGNDDVLGDDATSGGGAADVILGQGGTDRLRGGDGDDYVEGGQGSDRVDGDGGDDDLVGGSSTRLIPGAATDAASGQFDAGDQLFGGSGNDVITGDNGVVNRVTSSSDSGVFYDVTRNLRGPAKGALIAARYLQALDLNNAGSYLTPPLAARYGDDQASGGDGTDVILGQDGNDALSGGSGDDYVEGNGGTDTVRGDLPLTATAPLSTTDIAGRTTNAESTVAPFANPGWPSILPPDTSTDDQSGPGGTDGQDDLIGGSSLQGFRDGDDVVEGDGAADTILGDNGTLVRSLKEASYSGYATYDKRSASTSATATAVLRQHAPSVAKLTSTRFCPKSGSGPTATCEVLGAYGNDRLFGDTGDDTLWGGDGSDWMHGGAGSDDMYGEQGSDSMFGDAGEDAMLGDRGGIVDTYLTGKLNGDTALLGGSFTKTTNAPPKVTYHGLVAGTVDRRVDLLHDIDGSAFNAASTAAAMPVDGASYGGDDIMRGGSGRDVMHGGYGDDLMNGDGGGDVVFGDVGADVLWGGRGCDPSPASEDYIAGCALSPVDQPGKGAAVQDSIVTVPDGRGTTFQLTAGSIDQLFGGKGGTSPASLAGAKGADLMDWRPRGDGRQGKAGCAAGAWPTQVGTGPVLDPCAWFAMTNLDDDDPANTDPAAPAARDNQHHQGIDWMYGGKDRDVMQADVASNGPNNGDFQGDWTGVYNLYTHCNSAYGGFNDVHLLSPDWQQFMQGWAFAAGAGQSAADINGSTTSSFEELALVYTSDISANNSGSPYPSTPGHFDNPNACAP